MNTIQDEFYEDTRLQLGHIAAEISQLLASMDERNYHQFIIEVLKSQVFLNKDVIIEQLRIAEESIRDVRALIDQ
jgi:hypothetical protein